MAPRAVKQAILDQLIVCGADTVFGNPGTFEQALLEAIQEEPRLRYILGLQEAAVVAMATNYGRISRKAAIVQLHAGVGLGNAMGALQEAHRGEVPMIVFCGENSLDQEPLDGYLACDLVDLARPVVKWAVRLTSPIQSVRIIRRAWLRANTAPRGPVLVALPMDVLDAMTDAKSEPVIDIVTQAAPSNEVLQQIATAFSNAKDPVLIVGDAAIWSQAEQSILSFATATNAAIWGMNLTMAGSLLCQPQFKGMLRYSSGKSVRDALRSADAILTVGATLGTEVLPLASGDYLAPGTKLFQIDPNSLEVGKNIIPSIGVVADPKVCFDSLLGMVKASAHSVKQSTKPARKDNRNSLRFGYVEMMEALVSALPENTFILDESMTAAEELRAELRYRPDLEYLSCLSRGLGSAWPGAVAAQLLKPDQRVMGLSADGSAMYILPALWTAAHLKLPIVFATCNNRAYHVLKRNILNYWQEHQSENKSNFPYMDLGPPFIDFAKLGEGMGLRAFSANDKQSVIASIEEAFSCRSTCIVDINVQPSDP